MVSISHSFKSNRTKFGSSITYKSPQNLMLDVSFCVHAQFFSCPPDSISFKSSPPCHVLDDDEVWGEYSGCFDSTQSAQALNILTPDANTAKWYATHCLGLSCFSFLSSLGTWRFKRQEESGSPSKTYCQKHSIKPTLCKQCFMEEGDCCLKMPGSWINQMPLQSLPLEYILHIPKNGVDTFSRALILLQGRASARFSQHSWRLWSLLHKSVCFKNHRFFLKKASFQPLWLRKGIPVFILPSFQRPKGTIRLWSLIQS